MALFDSVINEIRAKFDIGDKADSLLAVLLTMIADKSGGGFSGFLDTFEKAGLGDTASSWINSSANMPLSYEQTESVFGEGTLKDISKEVGLDYKTTTSATALMTPHIVNNLTPTGEVPDDEDLRSMIGGYLTGTAEGAGRSETVGTLNNVGENNAGGNSLLKILIPLIILGLLLAMGYTFCSGSNATNATNGNTNMRETNRVQ